ncbi:MAG: DUF2194 domain-containing protein [Lachnospiraceae bacterium]|nr:DUF2194 domain-containing protein [Lachnospiraceae bacterium]
MSRLKRIRKRIQRDFFDFRMGGMYILGMAFFLITVVLILVQANVRYSIRPERLSMASKGELIRQKSSMDCFTKEEIEDDTIPNRFTEGNGTLLVLEDGEATSLKAKKIYLPVLDQMKDPYDVCEAYDFEPEMLKTHDKLILAITNYRKLGESISDIRDWVKEGGNLMIAYPPIYSGSFATLFDILGIKSSGNAAMVEGLHFNKNFMIGGISRDYEIIDAYESGISLALTEDCDVYLQSTGEYPLPLIWRRETGEGSIVFDNFGVLEKAYRGIHASAFTLLDDAYVYPVINGSAFYIDDFPSPVPEGDGKYITRDYNISISDFYSQIWWNDMYELAQKYDIDYTGLVIEDYSAQVKGKFKRNTDVNRFQYFGNMLLRSGGEIGIHGYNHMPLVLENFDYQDQYDSYVQWPGTEDMRNSLKEVFDFTGELFDQEELQVYVPPSNVLSEEGRNILTETPIRSIASVYLPTDLAYEQEFDVSAKDGIINTPRITSGTVIDEYMMIAAMSELNLHMVNTHFVHPDDVLDEDRGAALGWEKLYGNLKDYLDWLYTNCPSIRNLTGSELAAAVQRYDLCKVTREYDKEGVSLTVDNFDKEAYVMYRTNKGRSVSRVQGGSYKSVADGLYLIKCDAPRVRIDLKQEQK